MRDPSASTAYGQSNLFNEAERRRRHNKGLDDTGFKKALDSRGEYHQPTGTLHEAKGGGGALAEWGEAFPSGGAVGEYRVTDGGC